MKPTSSRPAALRLARTVIRTLTPAHLAAARGGTAGAQVVGGGGGNDGPSRGLDSIGFDSAPPAGDPIDQGCASISIVYAEI